MGKSGIKTPRVNWVAADLPTEFASFRQYCELIFRGPFADKDEAARVTYILLWVGQEGLCMEKTWDLSDSHSKKVDVICGRFKCIIEPKANFRLSRFNLQKFRQTALESVDEFTTRCRIQGENGDALEAEERLIEQLNIGIRHTKIQEKLLSRDDILPIDTAMDIARSHESTLADMNAFQSETSLTTHQVKQRREDGKQREDRRSNCTNCNRQHPTGKCPAANSKCRACGRFVIGRQYAGANRQPMVPSQALRSPGDHAHNPGQGDEAINKPSTSCVSTKTAAMMTRSNTWNLTVSQTMTGETRCLRI